MKAIYFVAILSVATLVVAVSNETLQIPTECPDEDPKDTTIHLAHADCTKFYMCLGGKKIEKQCPIMDDITKERLHFNPKHQVCDWPFRAGCKGHRTTPEPRPTSDPFECPANTGGRTIKIADPSTCDHFYLCTDGKKDLVKCPNGDHFNPKTSECDAPGNVNCNRGTTTPIPIPTPPNPFICPANTGGKTWRIPDQSTCDHFWLCTDGKRELVKCPNEKHFNPKTRECDLPRDVNCKTQCPANTEGKTVRFPHENLCDHFYLCVDGKQTLVKCPNNQHFNPSTLQCDAPENVKCNPGHKPSTTTTISTTISTTTSAPTTPNPTNCPTNTGGITRKIPDQLTCDHFFLCTDGKRELVKCPHGNYFNPKTFECDSPGNVNCKLHCPVNTEGKSLRRPDQSTCDHFWLCTDGKQELIKCPDGNHFNPNTLVCDLPENVKCNRPTIPIPTIIIPSSSYCPKNTGGKTIKVRDSFWCDHFWLCTNGKRELMKCPDGTHFNPKTLECNSSENVNCQIDCPASTGGKTIKLPHEYLCDHFYLCTDGQRSLTKCLSGRLFNPRLFICDVPEKVDCKYPSSTPSTTISTPTTSKSNLCPPKGSNQVVRFSHECQCNRYYECMNGDIVLRMCPKGLHYDHIRQQCNFPHIAKCAQPKPHILTNITVATQTIAYKCSIEEEGKKYQHFKSCTAYYECVHGRRILKYCKAGLHFNVALQTCEYPDKNCDLTTRIPIATIPPTIPRNGVCPPKGSTKKLLLPHECSCTDYYECVEGLQILRHCPTGLHYDHVRQICDKPYIVKCVRPIITCTGKKDGTYLPHEQKCTLFYICHNEKKILKKCKAGLYFNPILHVCDFPDNVYCGEVTSRSKFSSKCPSDGIHKIPHENDCKLYYICSDGKRSLLKCPQGFHFNPNSVLCDLPESSPCVNNFMIDETTIKLADGCIGTCPIPDPSNYTVIRPHKDCRKFCMCSNGMKIVQNCPDDLHFDHIKQTCNYPGAAVCAIPPGKQDTFVSDESLDKDDNSSLESLNEDDDDNERNTHGSFWSRLFMLGRYF